MGGASNIIARRFKTLLENFVSYSGGMVNYLKSCIYGWITTAQTLQSTASIFEVSCKLDWGHFSYLGMPVSVGSLKAEVWDTIIDKMKRKVQQWGSFWLNPAGRLTLLKSCLSSLPLYQFTLLQAPASFHHKVEAILRHFLWQGGKTERKKYNLINWKQVIQPHDYGGLGIRSPQLLNLVFGGKIIWRLINGESTWWKKVQETKYLNSHRQLLLDHDIPLRACTKIWGLCKKAIPILASNISKVSKGGNSTRIGADKILGQLPISSKPGTHQILTYLDSKGIHSLSQISKWDIHTHLWTGWHFSNIPDELLSSLENLQTQLHGIAPTK